MTESANKPKMKRAKKHLCEDHFIHNAFHLFYSASKIVSEKKSGPVSFLSTEDQEQAKQILDQMLHSILFLGNIHASLYRPEQIFSVVEMFLKIEEDFPGASCDYRTHVARRTPFSYFLELVTLCYSQEGDQMRILSELLKVCKKSGDFYPLISTVICKCEGNEFKYYGMSLSCESDREREIMTAVSCLHVWHCKVSSAVMSVFPKDTGNPRRITLPSTVRCRAYALKSYALKDLSQVKPPCERCHELYSLPNPSGPKYSPGNCAETEAISNLLHDQKGVNDNTTITVGVYKKQEIQEKMTACFDKHKTAINDRRQKENQIKHDIQTVYSV